MGDEQFVRMTKAPFGHDCKVCLKPFTVFRWCPGRGMRFRRTEICQTCCRLKNVCQSCILDLQYALPVQIRDGVLQIKDACPQNEANREYFLANNASKLARNDVSLIDYDKSDPAAKAILEQLSEKHAARSKAPSERNLPPPCSFYAKGTCKRGSECPYRHILTVERLSSLKSYRNRYYGTDDPAAEALINKNPELRDAINRDASSSIAALAIPQDRTIKSLLVMGLRDGVGAVEVQEFFEGVQGVKMVADGTAAVVTFKTRLEAEEAAQDHLGFAEISGVRIKVSWTTTAPPNQNFRKGPKRVHTEKAESEKDPAEAEAEAEEESINAKKSRSRGPPPPPTSQNKPDYSSRHTGQ
jgi:pre-mRNA-splicing factor RBM22/SLT11